MAADSGTPGSEAGFFDWAVRELVACPVCHARLAHHSTSLKCTVCLREYRVEDGIPDLVAGPLPVALDLEEGWYSGPPAGTPTAPLSEGHHRAHAAARAPITDYLRWLGCDAHSWILSVATGIGVEIPFLQAVSQRIVGIDISPAALRAFRRRWPFPVFRAEAGRLPFRDGAFDALVARALLHHLAGFTSLAPYLAEFVRVIRPGGVIVAVEPNAWYPVQWILWPLNRLVQRIRPGWRGLVPHERPLTPPFLVRQFRSAGLRDAGYVATTFTHNRFPRWISDWLVPREKRLRARRLFRALGWWILVWGHRVDGSS